MGRLLLGYVTVTALIAGSWLWTLSTPLTTAVVNLQTHNLTAVAQSAALLVIDSTQPLDRIAHQMVARTDMRVTIVAADGRVLADSDVDPATMTNHAGRPEIAAALAGNVGYDRRSSATEGTEQLYVAVPSNSAGERVVVRVSQPLDDIRSFAANARRLALTLLALTVLASVAIALRSARSASAPVTALSGIAQEMASGDLAVHMPVVPADLRPLADALEILRSQMRRRIEALDAERASLRAALDGLQDAVIVLDADQPILVNAAACSMFRTPARAWLATSLRESPLPPPLAAAIADHAQTRTHASTDLDPDPTGRVFRLYVAPIDDAANERRTIAVISDVSERARLWSVRRDFVSNASHELKTPVSGIGLLAESAGHALSDGDVEQARLFAAQIVESTARLQRLVTELLDLSRLESAPSPDSIVDVRQALANARIAFWPAAQRKVLELSFETGSVADEDVFAAAEATDLAIALDNLIENALAYTDVGGVVVSVEASASEVIITVTDTGAGIEPEHLGRIFERFYRADRSRSREIGGTGLGLSLVRHAAERSGGRVEAASMPGSGSTFTLTLPRALGGRRPTS